METKVVRKSARTVEAIRVTILGVKGHTDAEIKAHAMESAGETPASLFGAMVYRVGNMATVELYRD